MQACSLAVLLCATHANAQIAFENVSAAAGFSRFGVSWGAAWGDFNGDGRPDLWAGNHNHGMPSLYLNRGDGTFEDVAATVLVGRFTGDRHGAAWADFDNDGDQDLISVEGNSLGFVGPPNQLFVNQGAQLVDLAGSLGVAYPDPNPFNGIGGNMTPLWLDYDADGRLDLLISTLNPTVPSALFAQNDAGFVQSNAAAGFALYGQSAFAQITGLGAAGSPLLLNHSYAYPDHAWFYDAEPFEDRTAQFGLAARESVTRDVAVADFNGDGRTDLLLLRREDASDLLQTAPGKVRTTLQPQGSEVGFSFRASGSVILRIGPPNFVFPSDIYLGPDGEHRAMIQFPAPEPNSWLLPLPAAAAYGPGVAPHVPGTDFGVYIGKENDPLRWTVKVSHPEFFTVNIEVIAVGGGSLTEVTPIGFTPSIGAQTPVLKLRLPLGFVNAPALAALAIPMACESIGAGDFDNDMDVDAFLVCDRRVGNIPDVLLENLGGVVFRPVANAGGAAGSGAGRGDSVALADYDEDGFLDLFVTNGAGDPFYNEGPDQLFRNLGNTNHWLQIDLEGSVSNRDGIGARVLVQAGGVTQVREQGGGIHRYTQNFKRLHFGLGAHTSVDSVRVEWPSGIVQELSGVLIDRIVRITEPAAQSGAAARPLARGLSRPGAPRSPRSGTPAASR